MGKTTTVCAGIDVSKDKLDVALDGQAERLQVANDAEGHAALSAWLRARGVKRVGIEASGKHERPVVMQLRRDGFVVIMFQPAQVKAYARFTLQRAKNDNIDAGLIAACTAAARKIHAPPDPRLVAWSEQMTFIDQIEEDVARFKNRLETCHEPRIQAVWRAEIARLEKFSSSELKALIAAIRQHQDLATRLDLIESVDGIGIKTAVVILIRMPEIGRVTREQAAALAGLAPFDHDSGERAGSRHIAGGRERLRHSLYAAALPAAMRWNPQLVALYQRLSARGKDHKPVLVACARKLLIYANTVVARGTAWDSRRRPGGSAATQ